MMEPNKILKQDDADDLFSQIASTSHGQEQKNEKAKPVYWRAVLRVPGRSSFSRSHGPWQSTESVARTHATQYLKEGFHPKCVFIERLDYKKSTSKPGQEKEKEWIIVKIPL